MNKLENRKIEVKSTPNTYENCYLYISTYNREIK